VIKDLQGSRQIKLKSNLMKPMLDWLKGSSKIVLLAVGNQFRADDAVGLEIGKRIKGRSRKIKVILAETVPENFIGQILDLRPSHVLIVDSAELGLSPGQATFAKPSEIKGLPLSTHSLPLSMMAEHLEREGNLSVGFLLIQHRRLTFTQGLSLEVEQAVRALTKLILEASSEN
jgi:hydrogenase 3 maturation protease